jgi:hypothetical protein
LVSLGYGKACEAIVVTGQTPEHSVALTKKYHRDALSPDKIWKVEDYEYPPECETRLAGGRSVMFGQWNEPGMEQAYEKVRLSPGYSNLMSVCQHLTRLINIQTEEP